MKRDFFLKVLLTFSLAFVIGVVFGKFYPVVPAYQAVFWSCVGALALLTLGWFWWLKETLLDGESFQVSTLVFYCSLIVVAFLCGLGRYSVALEHLYANHLTEYLSADFSEPRVVEGRVTSPPKQKNGTIRLRISPDKLWLSPAREQKVKIQGGDLKLQVKPYHETGLDTEYLSQVGVYGDVLRITAPIMAPRKPTNPGGFSSREYMHSRGIYGNIWYAKKIELVERSSGNPFYWLVYNMSASLNENLEWSWAEAETKNAGTMWILGLTGFHVVLVVLEAWLLLKWWAVPRKYRLLLVLFILCIFTLIWKLDPVVLFAAAAGGLGLLAIDFGNRSWRTGVLVGTAGAALVTMLLTPRLIFAATFLGPLAAFLSLALLTEPVDRLLRKLYGVRFILFWLAAATTVILLIFAWDFLLTWYVYLPYLGLWALAFWTGPRLAGPVSLVGGVGFRDWPVVLRDLLAMQIALLAGLLWPLGTYFHQQFPLASVVTNFLVVPLGALAACFTFFGGLFGLVPGLGPWLAAIFNTGNLLVGQALAWLTRSAAVIFPRPAVTKPTLWHLLVLYSGLALFVWWDRVCQIARRSWNWLDEMFDVSTAVSFRKAGLVLLVLVGVVVFGTSFYFYPAPDKLRVTFLDVGFGEAIAVRTPAGSNLLFNAGARIGDHNLGKVGSQKTNYGERVVAPYFLSRGVKSFDLLALQSVQPQRSGGMAYITEKFLVDRALGSLSGKKISSGGELTLSRFVAALGDESYSRKMKEEWFKRDYYENWARWWGQLQAKDIPYRRPRRGRVVFRETNPSPNGPVQLEIKVLNPPVRPNFTNHAADNRSLVFRLKYGDVSFLFPGDIRNEAQAQLARLSQHNVQSDVLVVPSNGIRESSYNPEFVSAVDPKFVVLSASDRIRLRRTKYGSFVNKLEKQFKQTRKQYLKQFPDSRVFITQAGAAIFSTDGQKLEGRSF